MTANKVVLVTGSSRGIGAQTAKLFAQNAYSVCINYRSNLEAAEEVKQAVEGFGVDCIIVQADVSKLQEVARLFETIDKRLGQLSVLVNNVGTLRQQSRLSDISEDRFLEVLHTNVMSCFLCSKAAVKRMSTKLGGKGGAIVNVSSLAAKTGSPNEYIDYAASKGAMDSFTRGLAVEVASEGIRVNGVRPGFIYTDLHALGGEPTRVDRLKSKIPLQRGGHPIEVAEAIYWLSESGAAYVTGTFIDISGGV